MNGNSHRANGAPSTDRLSSVSITTAGENRLSAENASVGELFKQLSSDSSHLVRQEINLAKAELMESVGHMAKGATKVGIRYDDRVICLPCSGTLDQRALDMSLEHDEDHSQGCAACSSPI